MSGRYVLGVGGADPADAARAWAHSHAALSGAAVVRVHVGAPESRRESRRDREDAASADPTSADAASALVLPDGPIPATLADFLQPDDVLVIGTGKTGFIRSRVFGTLALQIAAQARCSVAVVPQVDLRFRSGVVAGIKDDDLLPAVVRAAVDEAHARAERVQLIHSSFAGLVPAPVPVGVAVLERATTLALARWSDAAVRARASARSPAEALLDASRNASLLVIGAGHPSGPGRALGSVVHDVLVNINAPVLLVRPASLEGTERAGIDADRMAR